MKSFLTLSLIITLLLLSSCSHSNLISADDLIQDRIISKENPQIGLNFVKAAKADSRLAAYLKEVSFLEQEIDELGAQMTRQVSGASLRWQDLNPEEGVLDFEETDPYIESIPMVGDCYSIQYASATPIWYDEWLEVDNKYNKEYLELITERYGDKIKYWEPGNEMSHWSLSEEYVSNNLVEFQKEMVNELPLALPPDSGAFTDEMKAEFYEYFVDSIRSKDNDAIILYPGMAGLSGKPLLELQNILALVDEDTFDIYNVHVYVPWYEIENKFIEFYKILKRFNETEKEIWVTENGVSSSETLISRTDYPNSREQQAADVFRRNSILYGLGVDYVAWHTHVSSVSENSLTGNWRGYGLRTPQGDKKESWYTYKLFTHELIPFNKLTQIDDYVFEYDTFEGKKYVLWSKEPVKYELKFPVDKVQVINVVPVLKDDEAFFEVKEIEGGQISLSLTDIPILVKEV